MQQISLIKIGSTVYDIKDAVSASTSGSEQKGSTKLYITGAESQTSDATTYSNNKCYIGTDDCLYSNGSKVLTAGSDFNPVTKYAQVGYDISRINGSGSLTIAGTDPIYVVNVTNNISSVALQTNPTYGHSCHVIFKSADSSSHTVVIGNDNTNRICPTSAGVSLTVPASGTGYIEVDFLNVGNSSVGDEVYVRGL